MGPEKIHIIYTAEDIQKYLSGKLGPSEMHAMEKAALDDAFLAEAMEGYDAMREKDLDSQLILLRDNFSKAQATKVIALQPATRNVFWKVAAAVCIICSGIAITYLFMTKDTSQNKSIAAINTKRDSVNSPVAEIMRPDTNTESNATAATKSKSTVQPGVARANQKGLADSKFIYRPGKAGKKEINQDTGGGYVDDQIESRNDISANNEAPPVQQPELEQYKKNNSKVTSRVLPDAAELQKREITVARKFTAQVEGPDGNPLPFANIRNANENFETYTDAMGNFTLVSSDSLLNIDIKSVGYISRNFNLRSDMAQNKIVLAVDEIALKEKTLAKGEVFARNKKRRPVMEPGSVMNAEPVDGWSNYETYISNNLSIPVEILQRKLHGEVEVSFEVQSNGTITNLKIDKSLCEACDEAALRVIKGGPGWKVKKGDNATAKVKVKF